jgi:hypothetical protein
MAVPVHDRAVGGSIQQGGSLEIGSQQSQLPNGGCNFRELSSGARAPVCGCKRFWLNAKSLGAQDQKDFCFCGHHACFHHWGSQQSRVPSQAAVSAVQAEAAQNTRGGRNTPDGYYAVHQAGAGASPRPSAGLGIQADFPSQSRSINTRVWDALNGFARDQDDGAASITTSKLPSTAVPSINGDAIPSYQQRPMGPPLNIPSLSLARAGFDPDMGSATEVATPSVAGTPDMRAFAPQNYHSRLLPAQLPATLPVAQASPTPQQQNPETFQATNQILTRDMENILQSYGRRLDVLESQSFSHVPVEEVQDKFEHYDDRLLDFEQWRSERDQERELEQAKRSEDSQKSSSSKRRRLLPNESSYSSFSSSGSFDSAAAMHAEAAVLATVATNLELEPRFEALETRVQDLENASMPSFARPWEVQVVLLPWGSELRGIWFTSSEATQQSQRSTLQDEEWTGPRPVPKASFQSSASKAWTTESIEAWAEEAQDWLSPKACGPSGDVFQRLASRGLVRDLTFTGSGSKHIWDTINSAFLKVLPVDSPAESGMSDEYQGLRVPFIPLRKVRKSTRLRFLSSAEMITSATWTADFLESSALMKVNDGQRRLYITTPHSYLQTGSEGWTWKSLQRLAARDDRGEVQSHRIRRNVAIEACWSYNDRLDYVPSLHSSFGSHVSRRSQGDPAEQKKLHHQPMSPLSDARTLHQRTSSLPASEAPTTAIKRRVASSGTSDIAPASSDPADLVSNKRPRLSVSPEAERRGVGITPRLSREPPSPFHSDINMIDSRSPGVLSSSRAMPRGTTPFAYATPHSNSNYMGVAELMGCGDGDTEIGTDLLGATSEHGDEEWQGVGDFVEGAQEDVIDEDDNDDQSMISDEDDDSELDDTSVDEDEGYTIYER